MRRRDFLARSALLGCSAAASPLLTPISLAAAPWDTRLVVIVLRGAMDGLDVIRPVGDAHYQALRPRIGGGADAGRLDLDGYFALNPGFERLYPMWQAGEFGAVHAVSTPYRDKRSHFDGQGILEAGVPDLAGGQGDGWLNRILQQVPEAESETAYAIGLDEMQILSGDAAVSRWSPETRLALSPQARQLLSVVHHGDPLFRDASEAAIEIAESIEMEAEMMAEVDESMSSSPMMEAVPRNGQHVRLAEFAASRLHGDARIVSFSLGGWDSHNKQLAAMQSRGRIFSDTLLSLQAGLGGLWSKTAVLCMTEFGRTAAENGSAGTDHGTGGAMLYAGGALRGGRVLGDWPGLAEEELYDRRDLMPTRDVRAYAAWVLASITGVSHSELERSIFPGVDMGARPEFLL